MQNFLFFMGLTLPLMGSAVALFGDDSPPAGPAQTPVPYLSAEEEAKRFALPEGYRMELVLADPIIKEPVVTFFDGNGRMFVAEMRSYMQDIDGRDDRTPNSRISLHSSTNVYALYDLHTLFI